MLDCMISVPQKAFISMIDNNPYGWGLSHGSSPTETDEFDNSWLHVIAALKKPVGYLFHWISRGLDTQYLNQAGETFLHLLDENICKDSDHHTLLSLLVRKGFPFGQRDCLGQTALHAMLQSSINKDILDRTLVHLSMLDIPIPTSRDCFGRTVTSELVQAGLSEAHIQTYFAAKQKMPVSPNYGAQTSIETFADLVLYERHADLLKTIIRASSYPLYEDQAGRNGVHCLAEVSFHLLPKHLLAQGHIENPKCREQKLKALLSAGVDVSNYDKQGHTPLMAFILHDREKEDETTFHALLAQLGNAGADVNRRDRRGQSAVHHAVQLGKRRATEFLLSRQANVHARDIDGKGIIALGMIYSKKAKRFSTRYAQIMLCIDLVSRAGGIAAPTFLHEWSTHKPAPQQVKTEGRWGLLPSKIRPMTIAARRKVWEDMGKRDESGI